MSNVKTIFGLDLSGRVGWAIGDLGGKVHAFGTKDLTGLRHDYGMMGFSFGQWLGDLIQEYKPSLIGIERPFMRGQSTYQQFGLSWTAHTIAFLHQVPRVEYTPQTIKKFFTGNLKSDKKAMVAKALSLGFQVTDDNQADAIGLLLLTIQNMKGNQ